MFKRQFLKTALLVLAVMLSFACVLPAYCAIETSLLVDVSASTDNVPYQQTQWYGFSGVGGKGYCATLTPLTGNSDLYLLDNGFNLKTSSKNTGLTVDKVWYGKSASGPMHLAAYGTANPSTNYTIQVISAPYVTSISPTSGGAGILVTINGFGFGATRGTNYVKFGNIQATSYYSWTNTQIKVYVPSGAGSGTVAINVYVAAVTSNAKNFNLPTLASSDGTMYKYDLGRTANYPNGPTTFPLNLKWTYNAGETLVNPPVIANNTAYIYKNMAKELLAIDATTGLLKWRYTGTAFQALFSTPAIAGGVVYVTGIDTADNGATVTTMLFAFDANTGSLKWKYNTTKDQSVALPSCGVAVFNNVVYFTAGTTVYAVNAATGTLKWTYTTTTAPQYGFTTNCAISNGVVYVGDYNGNSNGKVYALDAATGAVKWIYTIPEVGKFIRTEIFVTNGVIYFGTYGNGTWIGSLYALDANTGAVKWKNTGHIDVEMLGVADGIVYAGVNNGGWGFQAFDANTGALKWSTLSCGDIGISNGLVFTGSASLDVRDAKTGDLKWSYNIPVWAGPFVYNGNVYVCENSNLHCLGQ